MPKSFLSGMLDSFLSMLSQSSLEYLEARAAFHQGKGWGASSISDEVNACLLLLSTPPHCLIDVGGNKGLYTQDLLRRFPSVQCYIFEPSLYNTVILRESFHSNPNVTIVASALSNRNDKTYLYSDKPGSELSSLNYRRLDHFGIDMNEKELVSVMRFDSYWAKAARPSIIDIVKIDVEGHELMVLEGFGQLIDHIKLIQFEFGGCNIDSRVFFQDIWYFLEQKGFRIYRITPKGPCLLPSYRESCEFFGTTNFIAVNNALCR